MTVRSVAEVGEHDGERPRLEVLQTFQNQHATATWHGDIDNDGVGARIANGTDGVESKIGVAYDLQVWYFLKKLN